MTLWSAILRRAVEWGRPRGGHILHRYAGGQSGVRAGLLIIPVVIWSSTTGTSGADFAWQSFRGYRSTTYPALPAGNPGFTALASGTTGLAFTNQLLPEAEAQNQNLLNGAGLALGDYDNDGWCDVFLCNLNGSCALFRNLGDWKFTNVTVQAGLGGTNWLARGAVFADVDGDGNLDLVLTRSGKGARVFLNTGRGAFSEAPEPELIAETGSMSLSLGDIDGDGALDLYVANYGENTIRSGMKFSTRVVGGKEQVVGRMRNRLKIIAGQLVEYGEPDALYRNDGHGRFSRVSWTDGTFRDETGAALAAAPADLGLTAVIRDINQDGRPDIYVCNDFQDPDRMWLGMGQGQFKAVRRQALRLSSHFSMAADFADLDGDGLDDFMTSDMLSRQHALRMRQLAPRSPTLQQTLELALDRPQVRRNALFVNRGDGTYAEIANFAGVAASDWSWTVNFLDVDLDGWQDILIGTGHYYDTQDLDAIERSKMLTPAQRNDLRQVLSVFPPLRTPNVAFRNRGNLTFEEMGQAWGFNSLEVCHSLAMADLDNDGDLDIVVNCLNAPALVYRNDCGAPRLAVTLRGRPPNTRGIGARIKVLGGAVPMQTQEMTCGGRYLAADAPMRVFAAGTLTNDLTLEVTWRSGQRSLIPHLQPNRLVEVDEKGSEPAPVVEATTPPPRWFEQIDVLPGFKGREGAFDDFPRQLLLPKRLSQLGPGVAWADLDNDGRDDLIVGGQQGGKLTILRNQGQAQFVPWPGSPLSALPDDSTGMVRWSSGQGQSELLVGLASYKSGQSTAAERLSFTNGNLTVAGAIAAFGSSPGPLAVADFVGDGTLGLFIGGRMVPGRYPEVASSRLFRNQGGRLVEDEAASRIVNADVVAGGARKQGAGLVSGAVFTDLNGDGRPELVLACEWGPIRIFTQKPSGWAEVTAAWGLVDLTGLWTSVAAGDFDGDGRMDLVAGNRGLDSAYQQAAPGPWYLYYGDLNGDGQVQILEAYADAALQQVVPWRQMSLLEQSLPWLRAKYPTHLAFSTATVDQILAGRPGSTQRLTASHLASTLFLNRGDHFEMRPLPTVGQWAPVFGVGVADFDGDGHQDLFLAQNDEAVRPEDAPMNSGRGLLLRGDGQGGFAPLTGSESGILIYGQQRGCALADFDGDGRIDLAVAEANGQLHLCRNRAAAPGLRVRLHGPTGNPDGIGAVLRLRFADRSGPASEIHGGGGYWSQDSAEVLLAIPMAPQSLEVRWPGGRVTQTPVPPNVRSMTVDEHGQQSQ